MMDELPSANDLLRSSVRGPTRSVPEFVKFSMPLIKNTMPNLRVDNIIGVQPMTGNSHYIDYFNKPRSTLDGIVERIFAEEEEEDGAASG